MLARYTLMAILGYALHLSVLQLLARSARMWLGAAVCMLTAAAGGRAK